MISIILIVSLISVSVRGTCYWNRECPYQLFSSKTPYDAVRGDIRDYAIPDNCQATSIWALHRHGNRNPGSSVTLGMKEMAMLQDQIIASYDAGRSQLCAQDIDKFRRWTWNETLETTTSQLTGFGYEELYDIGKRIREKYPQLLTGSTADYYFRPTNEQRTITSSIAYCWVVTPTLNAWQESNTYVHGLTDGTNLTLTIDNVREREDVIRPYQNCDKYQEEVKTGPAVINEVAAYENTPAYIAVQNAVQQRLGITYQLTAANIYSIYELCRFYRSWEETLQSPWCSVFTNEDLLTLEYRDDVRHYHRNGYGSWVNVNLGGPPMKDLYENLQAAVQGQGRKIVSYFSHDTMMEMVWCALGLFKDEEQLVGNRWSEDRVWRTSFIGAMGTNLIVVLNSCQESGAQTHRVQFFINEKPTELCPLSGCTWAQFQEKFEPFTNSNLDFCSLDYPEPDVEPQFDSAVVPQASWLVVVQMVVLFWRR